MMRWIAGIGIGAALIGLVVLNLLTLQGLRKVDGSPNPAPPDPATVSSAAPATPARFDPDLIRAGLPATVSATLTAAVDPQKVTVSVKDRVSGTTADMTAGQPTSTLKVTLPANLTITVSAAGGDPPKTLIVRRTDVTFNGLPIAPPPSPLTGAPLTLPIASSGTYDLSVSGDDGVEVPLKFRLTIAPADPKVAAAPAIQSVNEVIKNAQGADETFVTAVGGAGSIPIHRPGGPVQSVALAAAGTPAFFLVDEKGNYVGKSDSTPPGALIFDNLTTGLHTIYAISQASPPAQVPQAGGVTIVVPRPGRPPEPIVEFFSVFRNITPTPYADPTVPILIFGSYLRLSGQNAPSGRLPRFISYTASTASNTFVREPNDVGATPTRGASGGGWDVTLTPPLSGADRRLFVLVEDEGSHATSRPIAYKTTGFTLSPELAPPAIGPLRATGAAADMNPDGPPGATNPHFSTNATSVTVTASVTLGTARPADAQAFLTREHRDETLTLPLAGAMGTSITFNRVPLREGTNRLTVSLVQGDQVGPTSATATIEVGSKPPTVLEVRPTNFGSTPGPQTLTIRLSGGPLDPGSVAQAAKANFGLEYSANGVFSGTSTDSPSAIVYDPAQNTITLSYDAIRVGIYRLTLIPFSDTNKTGLRDIFGNSIGGTLLFPLNAPTGQAAQAAGAATPSKDAPFVTYPEYTQPRDVPNGFNPSDRVETRVVRLYYYRDAHRVAQIVNRDLRAYNFAAVDVRKRLASEKRRDADTLTDQRRLQETRAERAAREARAAEARLAQAQQAVAGAAQQATTGPADVARLRGEVTSSQAAVQDAQDRFNAAVRDQAAATQPEQKAALQDAVNQARADLAEVQQAARDAQTRLDQAQAAASGAINALPAARQQLAAAQADVQAKRAAESAAADGALGDQQLEDRAREEQFRLEVAEAHEDPDHFAAGVPTSPDPVRQVSVSVIGEGLIQLRGPIKGVNIVRTMINQIDAPAGQVKVAIHTVQVNGEKGKRMEMVVGRIKDDIDHSRFLTMQASQMLRNAVVRVAARKADMVAQQCKSLPAGAVAGPGPERDLQETRDRMYVDVFFGRDFLLELDKIDSEFLMSGNKVLSLHSMDTTSLASAIFLMSLAKRSVRAEIIQEFQGMMASDLPVAEESYYLAGGPKGYKCKVLHHDKTQLLACNARFESFMGYFRDIDASDDALSPIQREFIRLAQIFKSRLVTELELNQRVKERAIIEERLGNRLEELTRQRTKDEAAQLALMQRQDEVRSQQVQILRQFAQIGATIQEVRKQVMDAREFRAVGSTKAFLAENIRYLLDSKQGFPQVRSLLAEATEAERADPKGAFALAAVDLAAAETKAREFLRRRDMSVSEAMDRTGELESDITALYTNLTRAAGSVRGADPARSQGILRVAAEFLRADSIVSLPISPERRKPFYIGNPDRPNPEDVVLMPTGPYNKQHDLPLPAHLQRLKDSDDDDLRKAFQWFKDCIDSAYKVHRLLQQFTIPDHRREEIEGAKAKLDDIARRASAASFTIDDYDDMLVILDRFTEELDPVYTKLTRTEAGYNRLIANLAGGASQIQSSYNRWAALRRSILDDVQGDLQQSASELVKNVDLAFQRLLEADLTYQFAKRNAEENRQPLDHKKLLDMLVDELEEKYIELLEGTRAHTANVDNYIKALATALDDDFNTQFYAPAFRRIRETGGSRDVQFAQIESTSILTNNRMFGKVVPQATMEFDLPKRDIAVVEAMNGAKAVMDDFGALVNDPTFLALTKLRSGQPTSSPAQGTTSGAASAVRNVLPGLPRQDDEEIMRQAGPGRREFGSAMEALIPDPAVYKFETGTGYEIRPVIQPDGQAVVFHFNYMYTTNVREPVRPDEKHLGRVKRQFIDDEVQLTNYELREVSAYRVGLKAARTGRGIPLFEDIPVAGVLFRPLPSAESSLQENIILAQSTIFPTLFDLMGLRWAPAVADLDTLRLRNADFIVRGRGRDLQNHVFDYSTTKVDDFIRIPPAERRTDLYRSQETIPDVHPNGFQGPGLNLRDSDLREGYEPRALHPESRPIPSTSREVRPEPPPTRPRLDEGDVMIEEAPAVEVVPPDPVPGPSDAMPRVVPLPAAPGTSPFDPRPSGPPGASPMRPAAPPTSPRVGTSALPPRTMLARPLPTSPPARNGGGPDAIDLDPIELPPLDGPNSGRPAGPPLGASPTRSGASPRDRGVSTTSGTRPGDSGRSPSSTARPSATRPPTSPTNPTATASARFSVVRDPSVNRTTATTTPRGVSPRANPPTIPAPSTSTRAKSSPKPPPPKAEASRRSIFSRLRGGEEGK